MTEWLKRHWRLLLTALGAGLAFVVGALLFWRRPRPQVGGGRDPEPLPPRPDLDEVPQPTTPDVKSLTPADDYLDEKTPVDEDGVIADLNRRFK